MFRDSENGITRRFLEEWHKPVVSALARAGAELANFEGRRFLTRPGFLTFEEHQRLSSDTVALYDILEQIPDRLFSGNTCAFGEAIGFRPDELEGMSSPEGIPTTRMGRADLYQTASGFKVLEFNAGSTAGNWVIGEMMRAAAQDADFRAFLDQEDLEFVDPWASYARVVLGEQRDSTPFVAIVDCSASFEQQQPHAGMLHDLQLLEVEAAVCHLAQLDIRSDGVFLHGRRVDVAYRIFAASDVLNDSASRQLYNALARAAQHGRVRLVTPLGTSLFGSKACLALLSDEDNAHAFEPSQREVLARIVPWTRQLRSGRTRTRGDQVELVSYVLAHREQLVLKPVRMYSGKGVLPGWTVEQSEWQSRVCSALASRDFIVQERVVPVTQRFASEDHPAKFDHMVLNWGPFCVGNTYCGAVLRGARVGNDGVITGGEEGILGGVFHARA